MELIKFDHFSNLSVSHIWAFTISLRKTPIGFHKPNPITFVKSGEADLFVLKSDIEKFSSFESKNQDLSLDNFLLEWNRNYKLALVSLNDMKDIKLSSLPNETLYKIYSILLSQNIEVMKLFFLLKLYGSASNSRNSIFRQFVLEKSISYEDIFLTSVKLLDSNIFEEISKRIYVTKDDALLMSPEEIYSALHGGIFDMEELKDRSLSYIMVYDLEKDAPHIYSGEKARVIEASLLRRV
ncbi:MAG: hypothetical protein NZ903_00570 [Candidatus Micrarchaeota archaeon]|nr:hypothetical protein [Candidatus Micrarchaeota archaeon]